MFAVLNPKRPKGLTPPPMPRFMWRMRFRSMSRYGHVCTYQVWYTYAAREHEGGDLISRRPIPLRSRRLEGGQIFADLRGAICEERFGSIEARLLVAGADSVLVITIETSGPAAGAGSLTAGGASTKQATLQVGCDVEAGYGHMELLASHFTDAPSLGVRMDNAGSAGIRLQTPGRR